MVEHRVPQHQIEAPIGEGQALGVGGHRAHIEPKALGVGAQSIQHPRRDVVAGRLLDHARAEQVEREVPRSRADLQRARVGPRMRTQDLAHLGDDLIVAELAEVDPPLGVVVIGCDVVVARVDVADLLGAQDWRHRAHHILARRTVSASVSLYQQRDQPEGVPPLELTGERTLPDVPEENYWYRRHVAVYEWIAARVGGLRTIDMACGEGYGSDLLARSAARRWWAWMPTPKPTSTRACATGAPTCASRASWWRPSPSPPTRSCSCRRSSTSRTPARCSSTSPRSSARAGKGRRTGRAGQERVARRPSTSPPRMCSRSPPRAPLARITPGTCTSTARRSSRRCAVRTSPPFSSSASSTRASCACTSWR